MTVKMNEKDLTALNGYLDNALSEQEMLEFADQMATKPELRSELADLLVVKRALKTLPVRKPPRSYILTRAMAAESRKPGILERLFPMFRAAGVFACFALIFTFIFPFFSLNSNAGQKAASPMMVQKSIEESQLTDSDEMDLAAISLESTPSLDEIGLGESSEPLNKASKGFRGGSPKLEYLVNTERVKPDDPDELPLAWSPEPADVEPVTTGNAEIDVQRMIQPEMAGTEPFSPMEIVRIASITVLALSLGWILLTLIRRRWAI